MDADLSPPHQHLVSKPASQCSEVIQASLSQRKFRREYRELIDELEDKRPEATFLRKSEMLLNIASQFQELDPRVSISCIQELNKMQGHLAPTRNINENRNMNITTNFEEMHEAVREIRQEY